MLTRKVAGGVALVAALGPGAALAESRDVIRPGSVERTVTLAAGEERDLSLACAGTGVALNAALTRRASGVEVRDSRPGSGGRGWRLTLVGSTGGRATAILRCVGADLPAGVSDVELRVASETPPAVTVPPLSTRRLEVACPAGYLPTGYGLDRGSTGVIRVAAAVPGSRGWTFRLENTDDAAASAAARIRCLRRVAGGRRDGERTALTFRIARRVFGDRVAGSASVAHRCRSSEFSLATGSTLDPAGGLVLTRSHPTGDRGGRWGFASGTGTQAVKTQLLCLDRRSVFG